MAIENCRGDARRVQLVATYDIEPIIRFKVTGIGFKGCCEPGHLIQDECTMFKATSRARKTMEFFFVGKHCAEEFSAATGHPLPPRCNLIEDEPEDGGGANGQGEGHTHGGSGNRLSPLGNELYRAISIVLNILGSPPKDPLCGAISKIVAAGKNDPSSSALKTVNTVIQKMFRGRTLSMLIEERRQAGERIRHPKYEVLAQALKIAYPNLLLAEIMFR